MNNYKPLENYTHLNCPFENIIEVKHVNPAEKIIFQECSHTYDYYNNIKTFRDDIIQSGNFIEIFNSSVVLNELDKRAVSDGYEFYNFFVKNSENFLFNLKLYCSKEKTTKEEIQFLIRTFSDWKKYYFRECQREKNDIIDWLSRHKKMDQT